MGGSGSRLLCSIRAISVNLRKLTILESFGQALVSRGQRGLGVACVSRVPAGKIFGEAVEKTTYPDEISTSISG